MNDMAPLAIDKGASQELAVRVGEKKASLITQGVTHSSNPAQIYLQSLKSKTSKATMTSVLNRFVNVFSGYEGKGYLSFPWSRLSLESFLEAMLIIQVKPQAPEEVATGKPSELLSPNTVNLYIAAVKGVAKQAMLSQQMSIIEYERIRLYKKGSFYRRPAGRALPVAEIKSLMEETLTADSLIGVRDAAILAVLFGCGPRRSEVCQMRTQDVDLDSGVITIIGKGDKERTLNMPARTRQALMLWLDARGSDIESDYVFLGITKWGQVRETPMAPSSIYRIVTSRAAAAGLSHATPHDLRRSFITYLFDQNVAAETVADMVGHERVDTTRRYDRGREKRKAQAAKLVDF